MKFYRVWRYAWQYFAPVLGFITLGKLLRFSAQDAVSFLARAGEFLLSMNALWLLLTIVFFYFSLVEWLYRDTPLTVISSSIDLIIERPDGSGATVNRVQTLRPNREGVTGYNVNLWTDTHVPGSSIPRETIKMHVDCFPDSDQNVMVVSGDEKAWNVIHRFPDLPVSPFRLGQPITRTESYHIKDSFTSKTEWYDVIISHTYRHKRLALTVFFPKDGLPNKCEALMIAKNGVVPLIPQHVYTKGGDQGYRITPRRPTAGTTYRILWYR